MTIPAAVTTSAQGTDVSAFQVDLTVHDLSGLQFAITKASDGRLITDPNFAHNWPVIAQARKHRGAYHELWAPKAPVKAQADHFLSVVHGGGLLAGDMLIVVASDYTGVTDAEVKEFCDLVKDATHGRCPVLVYTDLDVSHHLLASSAAYGLHLAWPSSAAPVRAQWAPAKWKTWRLWQWGTRVIPGLGEVDADAYNGTPADMDAWITTFSQPRTHLVKVTADGTASLRDLVAAHPGNGIANVVKETLLWSQGHRWQAEMAAYVNAGDWDALLAEGTVLRLWVTS